MIPKRDLPAEMLLRVASVVGLAASITVGTAQTKKFEVASIRPADPSETTMYSRPLPGGGYLAKNISIKGLIQNAYDLHDFQIVGAPSWIDSAKFDISAKAESDDSSTEKHRLPLLSI